MKKIKKKFLVITGLLIFFTITITGCSNENINSEPNSLKVKEIENLNSEIKGFSSNKLAIDQNVFWIKGSGIVSQPQDKIEINIAIEQRDKDIINASNIVNTNVEKIINIAKSLGISEDDIETKDIEENAYEKFFQGAMKKFGISSPDELEDDKKKAFFNYVDKNYKADNETDQGDT